MTPPISHDYLLLQNLATYCLAHANNSSLLFEYMCSFLLLYIFPMCLLDTVSLLVYCYSMLL